MKRKFKNVFMLLTVAALLFTSNGLTAKAGEICPYCDTKVSRPLEQMFHTIYTNSNWSGEGTTFGHASRLVTQYNRNYRLRNADGTVTEVKIPFDGDPINLPYDMYWIDMSTGIGQLDTSPYGQTLINIPLGLYQRFDGQIYQFDPAIFYGYQSIDEYPYIDESYGIPYFYQDARFADWMCVNNSRLPDDVVEALQSTLNNNVVYPYEMVVANPALVDEMRYYANEYNEWYEIALERLYGLQ